MIIENNIPVAPKSGMTETMRNMAIGDSVVIPVLERTKIFQAAIQAGIKVTSRKINENEVRFWRTE